MAHLVFDCLGARADRYAVSPSMAFSLRISETSGQRVEAIALRCQIRIEPGRRRYSAAEAERLTDLFGERHRWAETLRPLQFTNVAIMVPRFTGSTEIDLPVMLSYDLEIGSARYFAGLDDGEVPLLLLFSGTVFAMAGGRLQAQQVPWSSEAAYRMPVSIWREAIDAHFPDSAWIKMTRRTLDELLRFKTRNALPTWDATLRALLAGVAGNARGSGAAGTAHDSGAAGTAPGTEAAGTAPDAGDDGNAQDAGAAGHAPGAASAEGQA